MAYRVCDATVRRRLRACQCPYCLRKFDSLDTLQYHINIHLGIKPYCCQYCHVSCMNETQLRLHESRRHPEHVAEKLAAGQEARDGEFGCDQCSYIAPNVHKLNRHMLTHTGEKPYSCSVCNQHFTQASSLKSHMQIHEGNKPVIPCPVCRTTFGRRSDLNAHIKQQHTKTGDYQCPKCGKYLADRYTFRMHMRKHNHNRSNPRFYCRQCNFVALSERDFCNHLDRHTLNDPLSCPFCDVIFVQRKPLEEHFLNEHQRQLGAWERKYTEGGVEVKHGVAEEQEEQISQGEEIAEQVDVKVEAIEKKLNGKREQHEEREKSGKREQANIRELSTDREKIVEKGKLDAKREQCDRKSENGDSDKQTAPNLTRSKFMYPPVEDCDDHHDHEHIGDGDGDGDEMELVELTEEEFEQCVTWENGHMKLVPI